MDNRALRRGNALLALVHAAQAVVILALSTDFSLPVTGAFMEGAPGGGLPKQVLLFDLRLGPSSAHSYCSQRSTTLSSRSRRAAHATNEVSQRASTLSAGSSTRCRHR